MFDQRPLRRLQWLTCVLLFTANAGGRPDARQPSLFARHPTPRVAAMADGPSAAALERAIRGAERRLAVPACDGLLDEFGDAQGRPLRETADLLAASAVRPIDRVIFREGREHRDCTERAIVAFTSPGSRVVFVCSQRFARLARDRAEHVIIHELLHTLGLPERPPTSAAIDRAVASRCSGTRRE